MRAERKRSTEGAFRAFHSRNFTIFWIGNLLANIGTWMQQVAEPWLVLSLSDSPSLLGLDSFVADAPVWVFILIGGVIADRRDRKRLILLLQGAQALCPLLLVLLLLKGKVTVALVICLSFVVGITDALSVPSVQAIVPSLVPDSDVSSAIALNSAQYNLSRVLGPLLAGLVMAGLGAVGCFGINVLSYLPFLIVICLLRLPILSTGQRGRAGSLREALGVVASHAPLQRALLTILGTSLLATPLVAFLPVLVRDVYHRGAPGFGNILSLFGVGGVLGAMIVLQFDEARARQRAASVGAVGMGTCLFVIAVTGEFSACLIGVLVAGACMVISNTSSNSILQSWVEASFRGRIAGLYSLAVRGGMSLGNLATGVAVAHFGARRTLAVDGILAIIFQLGVLLRTESTDAGAVGALEKVGDDCKVI